jgi:hypothetical protein
LHLLSFLPWAWPKEIHDHEVIFWFHLDYSQFLEDWAVIRPIEVAPICHTKNKNEIKCIFSSSSSSPFSFFYFFNSCNTGEYFLLPRDGPNLFEI